MAKPSSTFPLDADYTFSSKFIMPTHSQKRGSPSNTFLFVVAAVVVKPQNKWFRIWLKLGGNLKRL